MLLTKNGAKVMDIYIFKSYRRLKDKGTLSCLNIPISIFHTIFDSFEF
jgi:hypothetical protein